MTIAEKKAALRAYRNMDADVVRLLRERERWESRAMRMTSSLSRTPGGSGSSHGLEDAVAQIADIETQISAQIRLLRERRAKIVAAIEQIPDARQRTVLGLRYVDGMSFGQVAHAMHYSERSVYKLHGAGLQTIRLESVESVQ